MIDERQQPARARASRRGLLTGAGAVAGLGIAGGIGLAGGLAFDGRRTVTPAPVTPAPVTRRPVLSPPPSRCSSLPAIRRGQRTTGQYSKS
jgi:hypothetical protein